MTGTRPVEGMPGTWSHCGKRVNHPAHRHTVVMNEGPTPNVLCLGYPGNPDATVPPAQPRYDYSEWG